MTSTFITLRQIAYTKNGHRKPLTLFTISIDREDAGNWERKGEQQVGGQDGLEHF
jgi:hypothetical protein